MNEDHRQLFHMAFGTIIAVSTWLVGRETAAAILLFVLLAGLAIIQLKMRGMREKTVDFLLEKFERLVETPGKGALMFVIGALFLVTYAKNLDYAVGVLMILAVGDAVSTMAGTRGKHPLPWNGKKTWEGFIAFVIGASLASAYFLNVAALVLAILFGLVETLRIPVDDNLVIPASAVFIEALL